MMQTSEQLIKLLEEWGWTEVDKRSLGSWFNAPTGLLKSTYSLYVPTDEKVKGFERLLRASVECVAEIYGKTTSEIYASMSKFNPPMMQTSKKPKTRANAMTAAIIDYCNAIGWTVWRNNTTGLFDPSSAAEKLTKIDTSNWGKSQFMEFFAKQYRPTTGRIGLADILGYTRQGVHVEIETKAGDDVLTIEQQQCLIECAMKGGKPYVIAENPEKVRKAAKVFGFDLVPVLTIDEFCDLHKNWVV